MKRILLLLVFALVLKITYAQSNYNILVSDFKFEPKDLTITIGDTVTWHWVEGVHTATSDSTTGLNVFNSPITSEVQTFSFVFKSLGSHRFYCIPHGSPGGLGMSGTIQVNDIVPVELISFSVKFDDDYMLLTWETATEINNHGFDIERRIDKQLWSRIGFVKGNGTTTVRRTYRFEDEEIIEDGKYSYRLKQIDLDGRYEYFRSKSIDYKRELKYELHQNYPNPFNPVTSIMISVPISGYVSIRVYNLLGQEIAEIYSGFLEKGVHDFSFNAEDNISGIYLYKAEARGEDGSTFSGTRKMTLLR